MWIKQSIGEQRKALTALFDSPLQALAKRCASVWHDPVQLDKVLSEHVASIPHCHLLYAVDKMGKQISANITPDRLEDQYRGQDLSRRPYSVSLYPKRHFMLSSVYISQITGRPCISAVQPMIEEHQFLGFIVADFDIRNLPMSLSNTPASSTTPQENQIASETLIRTDFSKQQRVISLMDKEITHVNITLTKLMQQHGIFHCTLHFASAQAMLWHLDKPCEYRLYSVEQLLNESLYKKFPRRDYTEQAEFPADRIADVLERLRILRLSDSNLYLHSASLNIINCMAGLNFSSDGHSQYMNAELFLRHDLSFWFGKKAINAN